MQVQVSGKHVDVGQALRTRVTDDITTAIGKYFDRGGDADVVISREGHSFRADCAVTLASGQTLRAKLVVGADGRESWVRNQMGLSSQHDPYGELGVVANFKTELPHFGTAYQWFRADGVLASRTRARTDGQWQHAEHEGQAETTAITYCEIPPLSNPDFHFSFPAFFKPPLRAPGQAIREA